MTMPARSIVERLDVVGHLGDRQLSVLVNLFLDPLFFQTAEERFGHGMVPAVVLPAHTRLKGDSSGRIGATHRCRTGCPDRNESTCRGVVVAAPPTARHRARARGEWKALPPSPRSGARTDPGRQPGRASPATCGCR